MDGRQAEYPQSGLSSPYAHYNSHLSETSSADQSSAVQYSGGQDYKSSNFSSSATPDSSYGLPQSARSGNFPEYLQRSYPEGQQQPQSRYSSGAPAGSHAMAQTSNPTITQSSPSYPPPQYGSPYQPASHDMAQHYQSQQMPYARPDWPQQGYGQPMYGQTPTTGGAIPNMQAHAARPPQGQHPLSTVYSFVPIPGAQQHKRPRRRYEEIERMYKCGWNGCEKAYGTLNHLNAHVTMQSHGTKRTPEEFKEIRKEWKAKKKEEEHARKQDEERHRQESQRQGDAPPGPGAPSQYGQSHMMPPQMGGANQLPPMQYQGGSAQAPGQYGQPQQVDGPQQYGGYSNQYPQSPYTQGGMQYQQH